MRWPSVLLERSLQQTPTSNIDGVNGRILGQIELEVEMIIEMEMEVWVGVRVEGDLGE